MYCLIMIEADLVQVVNNMITSKIHDEVRHSFAKRMLSSLILGKYISKGTWWKICFDQQRKGLLKYGHTIDDCPRDRFNWSDMATEELIDFWVYKVKMKK